MIELVIRGTPYTNFLSASVTVALDALANNFMFTATAVNDFPAPRRGDAITVNVDNVKVLTGFIETVNGEESEGSHVITYEGRDKLGDLVDSQIDTIDEIRASDSLKLINIIQYVLDDINLDVAIVEQVSTPAFNKAEDIILPAVGENCFDFIKKYAAKRQVLLTSDGDGNFVITQSQPTNSNAVLQKLNNDNANNILTQSWSLDNRERFNRYIYKSQLEPRASKFGGTDDSTLLSFQNGEASDDEIRTGRQRVVVESNAYSNAQLVNRAKWNKQLAIAKDSSFNCVVKDHQKPGGGLWQVNTLVQINSESANINTPLLLNSIEFKQADGQPTVTQLSFVEPDVYSINERLLSQQTLSKKNDKLSFAYKFRNLDTT